MDHHLSFYDCSISTKTPAQSLGCKRPLRATQTYTSAYQIAQTYTSAQVNWRLNYTRKIQLVVLFDTIPVSLARLTAKIRPSTTNIGHII